MLGNIKENSHHYRHLVLAGLISSVIWYPIKRLAEKIVSSLNSENYVSYALSLLHLIALWKTCDYLMGEFDPKTQFDNILRNEKAEIVSAELNNKPLSSLGIFTEDIEKDTEEPFDYNKPITVWDQGNYALSQSKKILFFKCYDPDALTHVYKPIDKKFMPIIKNRVNLLKNSLRK